MPYVTRINRTIRQAADARSLPVAEVSAHFLPPWTGKFASRLLPPQPGRPPRLGPRPARRRGKHSGPFGLKIFLPNGPAACRRRVPLPAEAARLVIVPGKIANIVLR